MSLINRRGDSYALVVLAPIRDSTGFDVRLGDNILAPWP